MKKVLSIFCAMVTLLVMTVSAVASPIATSTNSLPPLELEFSPEEDVRNLEPGEKCELSKSVTPLENGYSKVTTIFVTNTSRARSVEGSAHYDVLEEIYSSETQNAWVQLSVDFYFNKSSNYISWSNGEVTSEKVDTQLCKSLTTTTPKGQGGSTFGTKWIKVYTNYTMTNNFGFSLTGSVWAKVSSNGNSSTSES